MKGVPAVNEGAVDVVNMTTGVAAAIAALWFPPAAFAQPIVSFAVAKFIERPKKILLDQLRQGNLDALSNEDAAEFIPMAYKFLEAAKEGEFEHNLRILASYIASELKNTPPQAANVAKIARRLEGMGEQDLEVISLIKRVGIDNAERVFDVDESLRFVSASLLHDRKGADSNLTLAQVRQSLEELAARGLLLADRASRLDKAEEYYDWGEIFEDLVSKATTLNK